MYELPTLEHAFIILDHKTGLYARAGGVWGKKPKIWATKGHLKLHFDMFISYNYLTLVYSIQNNCPYKGHEEIWDIVGNKNFVAFTDEFLVEYINEKRQKENKKELKRKKLALQEAEYQLNKDHQKYMESMK